MIWNDGGVPLTLTPLLAVRVSDPYKSASFRGDR